MTSKPKLSAKQQEQLSRDFHSGEYTRKELSTKYAVSYAYVCKLTRREKRNAVTLTIDPEFQSLVPPLSAPEFDLLTRQILEQGCLEPLYVWKDTQILLDGHNRYKICTENNKRYRFIEVPLASREAAKLWILEHQGGRRNLTDDQRAVLWNDIRELRSKGVQGEKLQKARDAKVGIRTEVRDPISVKSTEIESEKRDTRAEIAKEANISESKLRSAQALKRKDPKSYEEVRAGKSTLRDATKKVRTASDAVNKKTTIPPESATPAPDVEDVRQQLYEVVKRLTEMGALRWTFNKKEDALKASIEFIATRIYPKPGDTNYPPELDWVEFTFNRRTTCSGMSATKSYSFFDSEAFKKQLWEEHEKK